MKHRLFALVLVALSACDQAPTLPTTAAQPDRPVTQIGIAVAGFASLSTNLDHTCILDQAGRAYCAGYGGRGAIGYGGQAVVVEPYPVAGGLNFASISTGSLHTCALTPTGKAHCWGSNEMGELGTVTTPAQCLFATVPCAVVPVPVGGALTFAQIDAGNQFTCALNAAGRAYCWGENTLGQLGDGTTTRRTAPAPVASSLTFVDIRTGGFHACARTAAGDLYCWGYNLQGQLGAPSSNQCVYFQSYPCSTTPIHVGNAQRFMAVDPGTVHTCALDLNGRGFCWGSNSHGQLGDAGLNNQPLPTPVASTQTFNRIGSGTESSCAIDAADNGYCWGQSFGRSPALISGFKWRTLLPHDNHRCGLALDGSPYCWGREQRGELGNGGHHQEQFSTPQLMAPPHTFDRPPVAKIIVTGCVNLACSFNGMNSTDDFGIVSWTWNFGDGTTANGAIANHTFPQSGTYTVTLTVTDGVQQSHSAQTSVQVYYQPPTNTPPVARFTYTCVARVPPPGFDCSFDGSSSSDADGTVTGWSWSAPGKATKTGVATSYAYPASGNYSVTLTVTDNNGANNSQTQPIVVGAAPPPNQSPSANFTVNCVPRMPNVGSDCAFNGTSSSDPDGSIVGYVWSSPSKASKSGAIITYAFPRGANTTVTLTVTDNQGATGAKTLPVVIP